MSNWKEVELKELVKIRNDRKLVSTQNIANIPMELVSNEKLFCEYEIRAIDDIKSYTYCESDDLLLAKITPSLENGKQGIVPHDIPQGIAYATTEVFPIVPVNINNLFLYYILKLPKYRQKIIASMIGTTGRQRATKSSIEKLKVKVPDSLIEQKAIAEILSTVDEAIQKADEAIKITERIKQGMMQKLLSEGIGHKEFKETKIGRFPKEWEVKRINEVASIRNSSSRNSLDRVANIPMELLSENKMFCEYQVKDRSNIKSYTYCESGDLLLAKITPSLENGKQGIVPNSVPSGVAYATTEVFPIVARNIINQFLFYILHSKKYRNKIIASMIGTTGRQRATKKSIEELMIPIPNKDEQNKIVSILIDIDMKAEFERKRKHKLERIKQGLMDDLLTGRKRVKIN